MDWDKSSLLRSRRTWSKNSKTILICKKRNFFLGDTTLPRLVCLAYMRGFYFLFCCVEVSSVVLCLLCCVALCCNPLCRFALRCVAIRCVAVTLYLLSCVAVELLLCCICWVALLCVALWSVPLCCIALCCVALLTSSAFLVFRQC